MLTFSKIRCVLAAILVASAAAILVIGTVNSQSSGSGPAFVGQLAAPIDDVSVRLLRNWIDETESRNAPLLIVELDTPGGSIDAMREMTGMILDANLPVVVFVSPSGAHAASAGTFIVAASHVAAMSTGTNIGAASPVSSSGDNLPETLNNKVTQDTAALLRGIASQRNRNSDALEHTIFRAASYSDEEAMELGIIDLRAIDLPDLIAKLDGMTVEVGGYSRTLVTTGMTIERLETSPVQRLLRWVASPHIVFILLAVGGVLIIVELLLPGGYVAGVLGVGLLILAFLGLVNLPMNWIGLALIAAGLALMFVEMQAPGWGGFGAAGVVCFILGGFLLFGDSSIPGLPAPDIRVGVGVLAGTAAVMGGSLAGLWYFSRKARGIRVESASSRLIGEVGVVSTSLDPKGTVQVASELWTAVSYSGEVIESGESVVVAEVDGVTLTVMRKSSIEEIGRIPQ